MHFQLISLWRSVQPKLSSIGRRVVRVVGLGNDTDTLQCEPLRRGDRQAVLKTQEVPARPEFLGMIFKNLDHSAAWDCRKVCIASQQNKNPYPDNDVEIVDGRPVDFAEGSNNDTKADTVKADLLAVVDHAWTPLHDPSLAMGPRYSCCALDESGCIAAWPWLPRFFVGSFDELVLYRRTYILELYATFVSNRQIVFMCVSHIEFNFLDRWVRNVFVVQWKVARKVGQAKVADMDLMKAIESRVTRTPS
jgi:hypothetical protein